MISWVLFILFIEAERYYVMPKGHYLTYEECSFAQNVFVRTAPQPKINYDSICVKTDQVTMQ